MIRSRSAYDTSRHGVPTVAHQSRQTYGPTAWKKATGGCSHAPREAGTIRPTTCKKAAGGCPHTREIQDNGTYSLQRSRRWLPTHLRNPRQPDLQLARYANTEHLGQQLASKLHVAAHMPAGIGVCREIVFQAYNIQLISSIAATRYLRGLPPGHTAASISLGGTYRQCNHGSVSVPPGSPSGSYSCEHLSSTHATYIH